VSTIVSTIGTSGDYATIASWMTDLPNVGTAGDTHVGEIIDQEVEAPHQTFPATFGANTVILRPHPSIRHKGIFGSGCRMLATTTTALLTINSNGYAVTVDGLEIDASQFAISNSGTINLTGGAGSGSMTISNCLVKGSYNGGGSNAYGISSAGVSGTRLVFNCLVFNARRTSSFGGTVAFYNNGNSQNVYTHCVAVDTVGVGGTLGHGFTVGASNECRNCVSVANNGLGFNTASGNHNASSDGTAPGANSIQNINYLDHFEGILGGNARPIVGSSLLTAGVTTFVTHDILGNPYNNPPPIGFFASPPTSGGPSRPINPFTQQVIG
jgi:hypothetical protein